LADGTTKTGPPPSAVLDTIQAAGRPTLLGWIARMRTSPAFSFGDVGVFVVGRAAEESSIDWLFHLGDRRADDQGSGRWRPLWNRPAIGQDTTEPDDDDLADGAALI
jgi:hypothetical protein